MSSRNGIAGSYLYYFSPHGRNQASQLGGLEWGAQAYTTRSVARLSPKLFESQLSALFANICLCFSKVLHRCGLNPRIDFRCWRRADDLKSIAVCATPLLVRLAMPSTFLVFSPPWRDWVRFPTSSHPRYYLFGLVIVWAFVEKCENVPPHHMRVITSLS